MLYTIRFNNSVQTGQLHDRHELNVATDGADNVHEFRHSAAAVIRDRLNSTHREIPDDHFDRSVDNMVTQLKIQRANLQASLLPIKESPIVLDHTYVDHMIRQAGPELTGVADLAL